MKTFLPLKGLRVLDLAEEKGELCGRLLADLGADVLKIESPEGSISRFLPPFAPDGSSLYFAYRNTNKRASVIDSSTEQGVEQLRELINKSDVLIETFTPGTLTAIGLSPESLTNDNPTLIIASLTDFGQTGPDNHFQATNDVIFARSGWLSVSGTIDKPPLLAPGAVAYDTLGVVGAYAVLLGILQRDHCGKGQHIDVSALEALSQMNTWGIPNASASQLLETPVSLVRSGDSPLYPHIPCKDGFVRQVILAPRQWRSLWKWMGSPEAFADEYWESTINRYLNLDVLNPVFWEHWKDKSMIEACTEAQKLGVIATPMLTPKDVLESNHYKSRKTFIKEKFFEELEGPLMSGFAEVNGERIGFRSPAPKINQDKALFEDEIFAPPTKTLHPSEMPLEGVRVIDFGHGGVGVECGRMLAEYGADVIKIESWAYPDFIRIVLGGTMTASFASSNRTKRGFSANLKNPKAREVILKLIKGADIIIENNSTGTMEALGLGYETLKQINPDLIMVSSQLMGSRGDFADWSGYGPTIQTVSGLSWLWAFKDGDPPPGTTAIHPDHLAGRMAAVFALAGVIGINRGASGNHTEVAQVEVLIGTLGDLFLKEGIEPGTLTPQGNDSERGAPWGPFVCEGEESWCVVCVRDDNDWDKLLNLMDISKSAYPEFATSKLRISNRSGVNNLLSQWTISKSALEVEQKCQTLGIPAGRVLTSAEQLEDSHLIERGFLPEVLQNGGVGNIVLDGACITGSLMGNPIITKAPLIGEHTKEICLDELKMSKSEFELLLEDGAIAEIRADD